jgi:hypothetical protein
MLMAPRASSVPAERNRRQPINGRRRASQAPPVQPSPIRPALISQLARPKRKRLQDSESEADEPEGVYPSKQPRRFPPPEHELSEQNLRIFNGEEMDDAANNARPKGNKRSSSRPSTRAASDVTQETARTQRSSNTTAYYRFAHLKSAQVYVHTDPPEDIQKAIHAIIKAEPPEGRRDKLKTISQILHKGCTKTARAAVGEDDFVNLFHNTLMAMSPENLCLREKADWQEELKPKILRSRFNLDFLTGFDFMAGDQQQEADDASAPLRKRQQQSANQIYISPQSSMADRFDPTPANRSQKLATMPPPPLPSSVPEKEGDHSLIKTPHPDISIGTQFNALTSALSSQDLNGLEAQLFLSQLQNKMVHREPGGPQEPMLISVPALRASDLAFPFAVFEGKAYSTGKQVFEAENQAAVAGACGLKIQLCLDELVKRATPAPSQGQSTTSSDVLPALSKDQPAFFFSICTEGPIHELWAHWTNVEDGARTFHMTLLKICHGMLLEGVEDFIVAVDNVLRWGTGHFLESVVERLKKVIRNLRAAA